MKLDMMVLSTSTTPADIQELDFGIECVPAGDVGGMVPDYASIVQIETINGFHIGSLWAQGNAVDGTDNTVVKKNHINEKFRFMRKCDRIPGLEYSVIP